MENQFGRVSEVTLTVSGRNKETELKDVYFTAPFKVMRPFQMTGAIWQDWKELMIMSVSAGTMAGDRQLHRLTVEEGSRVKITSQAYEKIHRMKDGYAERITEITVENGAVLYYCPQPVIPFAGSDFRSRTKIHLKGTDAKLIMSDILCSGRTAMGEQFGYIYYSNLVESYKMADGEAVLSYRDNTRYQPGQMDMCGYGMYEGYGYLLNLLFSNISAEKSTIEAIWEKFDSFAEEKLTGGVSRTWDGDLVVRALAVSAEVLEKLSEEIVELVMSEEMSNLQVKNEG